MSDGSDLGSDGPNYYGTPASNNSSGTGIMQPSPTPPNDTPHTADNNDDGGTSCDLIDIKLDVLSGLVEVEVDGNDSSLGIDVDLAGEDIVNLDIGGPGSVIPGLIDVDLGGSDGHPAAILDVVLGGDDALNVTVLHGSDIFGSGHDVLNSCGVLDGVFDDCSLLG